MAKLYARISAGLEEALNSRFFLRSPHWPDLSFIADSTQITSPTLNDNEMLKIARRVADLVLRAATSSAIAAAWYIRPPCTWPCA